MYIHMFTFSALKVAAVPTILRIRGYRIGFYQADLVEPPHVHVRKQEGHAKFWMTPVELAVSRGFAPHQVSEIRSILEEFREPILAAWQEQENKRGDRSSENPGQ